jgi:predicted DNA-binding transcriptional regulator YafY
MSTPLSTEGLTIAGAAKELGVSPRTIRRFIKAGKLFAELVPGQFGDEYRIFEVPLSLQKQKRLEIASGQNTSQTPSQTPSLTTSQTSVQTSVQFMDLVRELQEKNMTLAAQLGAATERIRALESQVKLLTTTRQPWWKRLFSRNG